MNPMNKIALIAAIIISSTFLQPLFAQHTANGKPTYHFISIKLPEGELLDNYNRFTPDTLMSLWEQYKLITKEKISELQKVYPKTATNLYISGLLKAQPVWRYSEADPDFYCAPWHYEQKVVNEMLSAIALDYPDTMQWLCNKLAGGDPHQYTQGSYYDERELFEYAIDRHIKLNVETLIARFDDTDMSAAQDPVNGTIFLRPESSHVLEYLLTLGNKRINDMLRQKITAFYKANTDNDIQASEEFKLFKKYGEQLY